MINKKTIKAYILLLPQIILSILFLLVLLKGIISSFGIIPYLKLQRPTLYYYQEVFLKKEFINSVFFSIYIAFVSAFLSTIIAIALAYLCLSKNKINKFFLELIKLPIIMPHIVVAICVVNLLSQNGILARFLFNINLLSSKDNFWFIVYSPQGLGIIIAYLWKEIPFVLYFIYTIMSKVDANLGEASINLGASKIQTFFLVTIPMCKNTIMSVFLIIFVFALGSFELPFLLGATYPKALSVLAYLEYSNPNLLHRPISMVINTLIIIIAIISAVIYMKLEEKSFV